MDALVKGCVDVLLVHNNSVLLARRNIEPQPGWWFVGGRMHPGESPEETAARHVLHDLKLQIDPNAFNFLTVASNVVRLGTPSAIASGKWNS